MFPYRVRKILNYDIKMSRIDILSNNKAGGNKVQLSNIPQFNPDESVTTIENKKLVELLLHQLSW